jgi:hypothetical protein
MNWYVSPVTLFCNRCTAHRSNDTEVVLIANIAGFVTFPPQCVNLVQPLDVATSIFIYNWKIEISNEIAKVAVSLADHTVDKSTEMYDSFKDESC